MGPGDRFQLSVFRGLGLCASYERWPYTHSITLTVLCFHVFIGLGSSYIDDDYKD